MAICSSPENKLGLSYDIDATSMRAAKYLPGTDACINLVNPTLFLSQSTSRVKRGTLYHLRTAAQEPLRMERIILLLVLFGSLCVKVCIGIFRNLALNMLFGTFSIERCICRLFLAEPKLILCTPIQYQLNERHNAMSILAWAQYLSLRLLANRFTTTKPKNI